MAARKQTQLDTHTDKPSTVEPGDAPADTTDPTERATLVTPDKATAAKSGHRTVNAVVPLPVVKTERNTGKDRTETYTAIQPDGTELTVTRNLETGEFEVSTPSTTTSSSTTRSTRSTPSA